MVETVESVELAVIGAGPAGMAAAKAARDCGVQVVMLDDQPRTGGQVFRHGAKPAALPRFAADIRDAYLHPSTLNIDYRPLHAVWAIDEQALHICGPRGNYQLRPKRTIIAAGASEWVPPISGATLPGVTTGGGAQALLKTSGVIVGHKIAIAGTGPLLLQLGAQLLDSGASITRIFEVASFSQWATNVLHTLRCPSLAAQGAVLLTKVVGRGVRMSFGRIPVRVRGETHVIGVDVARIERPSDVVESVDIDALCLSYGLVPATELANMRGCALRFSPEFGHWQVVRDSEMRTSIADVFAVGDGAAIGGARFALLEGAIAGYAAARDLRHSVSTTAIRRETGLKRSISRLRPARRFLQNTFRARPELVVGAAPDSLLCRCEEVTVGSARNAIRDGFRSLHELRVMTRVGMGPCQGRYCTTNALALLVTESGRPLQDLGPGSPRPPVRPITVGQIIGLQGL